MIEKKKIKVLFTGGALDDEHRHFLELRGYEIIIQPPTLTEAQLIDALNGVMAYIPAGEDKATKNVIQAASDLKLICFFGAGYENFVDVEAATQAGVAVTYTPGANAQATAEFTFGLILSLVRQIPYLNETTRRGQWLEERTWNLQNRTLGIIGMGNIAQKVAHIAKQGFNMRAIYHSRTRKEEIEKDLGLEWCATLEELLREADIITLHLPLIPETKGIIGKEQFEQMKDSAILINAARPTLVDPEALREALEKNLIGGVALDGYYTAPIPSIDADTFGLTKFGIDRLIVTPHTAYLTDGSVFTMTDMVFESIEAFFGGKDSIPYLINPDYSKVKRE